MTTSQAIWLGVMLACTPSLLLLAVFLLSPIDDSKGRDL